MLFWAEVIVATHVYWERELRVDAIGRKRDGEGDEEAGPPWSDGVDASVKPLVGATAWGPWIGYGSFLTINFGRPIGTFEQATRRHPARTTYRGEWMLWVYCSAWRIDGPDGIVAASEDDRIQMEIGAFVLDGRTVMSVSVGHPSLDITLEFTGGLVLRTFAIHSLEYEHWMLWMHDGRVLGAGPGSAWTWADPDPQPQ